MNDLLPNIRALSFDFSVSINDVRNFVERYLLHARRSDFQQSVFEAYLRRTTILTIQAILLFLLGFLLISWPTDYLYFTSKSAVRALFQFRICIAVAFVLVILGLEYSERLQKNVFMIGSILSLIAVTFPGYFLGPPEEVRLPFLYLVIPIPFIPAFFRIKLPQRIVLTFLVPIFYVTPFLLFISEPHNYYVLFNVTFAMIVISIILGHMVYHMERKRFFRRRELRNQRQKIERMARMDNLTGHLNRKTFFKQLRTEFERSVRSDSNLSFMMVDLDHFKEVNDTYGHLVGDTVLERFGEILSTNTRKSDISARYGGEEFAVLLPETPSEKAEVTAQRLLDKFGSEIFTLESGEEFSVTCSIGITERTESMEDEEDLIEWADRALYRAKEKGRNRYEIKQES